MFCAQEHTSSSKNMVLQVVLQLMQNVTFTVYAELQIPSAGSGTEAGESTAATWQ